MDVFMDQELLDLYQSGKSKRYKEVERNRELLDGFKRAVGLMMTVSEQLKYEWSGKSSVRISNRYVHRLIFTETNDGLEVELIEIDNTHYGNKR